MSVIDARLELLTPVGAAGVAVVMASGPGRLFSLARLLRLGSGRELSAADLSDRGPLRCSLVIDGVRIDEALFVDRPARSQAELHLHGSPAVLDALAAACPMRMGETEPDAASSLLRNADDERQVALALEQQACGGITAFLRALSFTPPELHGPALAAARERSRVAFAIANPARVVLFGPQNAGKSTLFNRLLLEERSLTGPQSGLTRDPVRERAVLSGYRYELIDTAGEGRAVDAVDALAQRRGQGLRRDGIGVLVCDGSRDLGAAAIALASTASLLVRSKGDLPASEAWPDLALPVMQISCSATRDAAWIRTVIGEALRRVRALPEAPTSGVGGPAALDSAQLALLDAAS